MVSKALHFPSVPSSSPHKLVSLAPLCSGEVPSYSRRGKVVSWTYGFSMTYLTKIAPFFGGVCLMILSWNKGFMALKCLPTLPSTIKTTHSSCSTLLTQLPRFLYVNLGSFLFFLKTLPLSDFCNACSASFPFGTVDDSVPFPSLLQAWTFPSILFSCRITVSHVFKWIFDLKIPKLNLILHSALHSLI